MVLPRVTIEMVPSKPITFQDNDILQKKRKKEVGTDDKIKVVTCLQSLNNAMYDYIGILFVHVTSVETDIGMT